MRLRCHRRGRAALAAAAAESAAPHLQSRSRQAASPAARDRRTRYSGDHSRDARATVGAGAMAGSRCADIAAELRFPIIARPRGSHAGVGLAKLDDRAALARLSRRTRRSRNSSSRASSIMPSDDGLFRKYRIVFVDGQPYACHMAIADRWDIWYLNAGMAFSAEQASRRRRLHAHLRHRLRCAPSRPRSPAMAERVGLDYFTIDCAENKRRRTADIRGGQHRRRAQHGFARGVSLQAAADAQDLRGVCGDAVAPRRDRAGAARHDRGAARSTACSRNRARRSIRRTGTTSAR